MKTPLLDRRSFLRAGGMAIALPYLEAMFPTSALAAGTSDPKRYICMYIASGTYLKTNNGAFWYPGSNNTALNAAALPDVFSPFADNAGDFSIIRGLGNKGKNQCNGGGDHSTAVASYLTSAGYSSTSSGMSGSSFDQAMAAKNGLKAYATSGGGSDGFHADGTPFDYSRTVSYSNGKQAETWLNPYALFQTLFANFTAPAPGQPPKTSVFVKNKSILDGAVGSINKLKGILGSADKQRVDDYYDKLRSFEAQLTAGGGAATATCDPSHPPSTDLNNEDHSGTRTDFGARLHSFMDIMSLSFQCNNAQMYSLMFEYENTARQFRNQIPTALVYQGADVNTPGSHIDMAHWSDGGSGQVTERRNRCVSRDRYYVSIMMYLVNSLKSVKDPSGSPILDNTVIQLGHGLEDGNHNTDGSNPGTGHPVVLAGGKNFGFKPGNFYAMGGKDLSDLYYTINQKMGMGLTSFGGSTTVLPL